MVTRRMLINLRSIFTSSVIFLMMPCFLIAGSYYVSWADTVDSGNSDHATGIAVDNTGNIIVTGAAKIGGDVDYLTIKYDSNGTVIWIDTLDNNGVSDSAMAIAVDGSNNIIVTGYSCISGNADYFTVKYDSNGIIQWTDTLDNGSDDFAMGVAVDNFNNVIVTGISTLDNQNYFTVKYDPAGNILWADTLGLEGDAGAYAVAVDDSNNVIVTGIRDSNVIHESITVKYDPAGNILWADSTSFVVWAIDIATDHDGNIIVTGGTTWPDDECITIKYRSNGTVQWMKYFDTGSGSCAAGVAVDDSNNIIIVGGAEGCCLSVKYSQGGTVLWTDVLHSGSFGYFWDVAVADLDDYIMTGSCIIGGDYDYFTANYEPSFPESVVAYVPEPYILYANGSDSSKVRGAIFDSGNDKIRGMADSLSFHAHLGSFYGNVIEHPNDSTYYQWYRADTLPGIDTTWIVCPCCSTCDSAMAIIVLLPTGIGEEESIVCTNSFLCDIYPNPFCEKIEISLIGVFERGKSGELAIYDISGQRVKTQSFVLSSSASSISIIWNGRDEREKQLPDGVYFLKISAGNYKTTRKVLLIK